MFLFCFNPRLTLLPWFCSVGKVTLISHPVSELHVLRTVIRGVNHDVTEEAANYKTEKRLHPPPTIRRADPAVYSELTVIKLCFL